MQKKKYEGSVYVGVVGSEDENGQCRDSILNIQLRNGDSLPRPIRATKGYEARQMHLDSFMNETQHAFILLLDSDMTFPVHTLERLRSHGKPYISGLYMRRRFLPVAPVWFEAGQKDVLTKRWFTRVWEDNTLYPLGASGWGCVLIHRDVIVATRAILKGEKEILEDDMDVYPYNLELVMSSIRGLESLAKIDTKDTALTQLALKEYSKTLSREIRPLSGQKSNINGSDVRFPFFARQAGYQLYGDTGVSCGHMLNYPLMPDDYRFGNPDAIKELDKEVNKLCATESKKQRDNVARLSGANG